MEIYRLDRQRDIAKTRERGHMLTVTDKKCSVCGVVKPVMEFPTHTYPSGKIRPLAFCSICHAKRCRDWYYKNKDRRKAYNSTPQGLARMRKSFEAYRLRHPDKTSAHIKAMTARRSGKLIRPTECSSCRKPCIPQGHHEDYSKPLEVIWLCRACHGAIHRKHKDVA